MVYPCEGKQRLGVTGRYRVGEHACETCYVPLSGPGQQAGNGVTPLVGSWVGEWLDDLSANPLEVTTG